MEFSNLFWHHLHRYAPIYHSKCKILHGVFISTNYLLQVLGEKMPEKRTHEELEQRIHDTTERHQAEEDLRAKEERYRTLLESIEEAYFEVDLKGNFIFFIFANYWKFSNFFIIIFFINFNTCISVIASSIDSYIIFTC